MTVPTIQSGLLAQMDMGMVEDALFKMTVT
jgi:hypothetical protein